MACRICLAPVSDVLDLGSSPPANSLKVSRNQEESSYPLVLQWCADCGNVQLRDTLNEVDLYRDYLYVTPTSSMLASHYEYLFSFLEARGYVSPGSFVVEPGSNAGQFLALIQRRVRMVLGVDPATTIVQQALDAGVPTLCQFFSREVAQSILTTNGPADLVIARHCLAHNASPHEMVQAAGDMLDGHGFFVIENAYVVNTIENGEFDQIYHEHMFYFSIRSMRQLLEMHGFRLVDVTTSLVHGGSIIFVATPDPSAPVSASVRAMETRERSVVTASEFQRFRQRAERVRDDLRELAEETKREGLTIYSYGATAKGNTLLNYCGFAETDIALCVDSTPMKHGRYLPKSNIPVVPENVAISEPPDYFLLTAWNYQEEIVSKVRAAGNSSSNFIVPVPYVRII